MEKKIKILHVITRMIVGGAQENTLFCCAGLNKKSAYEVVLLSGPQTGPEGSLLERARQIARLVVLDELRRDINPWTDFAAFFRLYRFIRAERFTVVHTHSSKAGITGRFAARLAGVPVIIHTIHGLPFFKDQTWIINKFYIFLERLAARFTNSLICVCRSVAADAVRAGIAPARKFAVVHSGIELESFAASQSLKAEMKKRLGIPGERPVVGKIARLFHRKGHEYLLRAAGRIKKAVPNAHFLFIGDGILKGRLQDLCASLGLNEAVTFAGLIPPEEIPRYAQAIDVLVHASLHEGLPRAVVQAFALGIPAVCFDCDGARDIIDDGVNGFLAAPKDIDGLSSRVTELLRDREKAVRMGEAGRRFVRSFFSAQEMVEAIDRIYREQLAHACGERGP